MIPTKSSAAAPEMERSVLGCMLFSKTAMQIALQYLSVDDFYCSEHKIIFKCLSTLSSAGKQVDLAILAIRLKDENTLDSIGGVPYLTSLISTVETSVYVDEYCDIIKRKSLLRQMSDGVFRSGQIVEGCIDDIDSALDQIRQIFFDIGRHSTSTPIIPFNTLMDEYSLENMSKIKLRFDSLGPNSAPITGIPTSMAHLDKIIDGLGPTHMIILAARPAMGKTTFALNIASNVCYKSDIPVAIFSLEMTARQLAQKMLCCYSGIDSQKIRTGELSSHEVELVAQSADQMRTNKIIIDDMPIVKMSDLKARARRLRERENVGLIVIDYLQLIRYGDRKMDRYNEVTEISREIKLMAKELEVPIVCLSQLSRKTEDRIGHRPLLSDLRDSGSIEQDADVIILLHRRDYYDPYDHPGSIDVLVAKNRHGSIGNIQMRFEKEIGKFSDIDVV